MTVAVDTTELKPSADDAVASVRHGISFKFCPECVTHWNRCTEPVCVVRYGANSGRGIPNQSFCTLLCSWPKNWPRRRSILTESCSERTLVAGRERRRAEGKR